MKTKQSTQEQGEQYIDEGWSIYHKNGHLYAERTLECATVERVLVGPMDWAEYHNWAE